MVWKCTNTSCSNTERATPVFSSQAEGVCQRAISDEGAVSRPLCQIGDNVYIDSNLDGGFDLDQDVVLRRDGSRLSPDDARNALKILGYDPDFAGCFYGSAPACYPDLEAIRMKHGYWPQHFTVIAAAGSAEIASLTGLPRAFEKNFKQIKTPEQTVQLFSLFRNGVHINDADCRPRGGIDIGVGCNHHTTTGRLGMIEGWGYNPDTVQEDAKNRFIIVIYANIDYQTESYLKAFATRLSSAFALQAGHVAWIGRSLSSEIIRGGLLLVRQKVPANQKAEAMVLYYAHGISQKDNPSEWETMLHEGWFEDDIIGELDFRKLLIDNLSPDMFSSVLLLVNSCHSEMLVDSGNKNDNNSCRRPQL